MLSPGRMDLWAATLLATFLLEVAASPSPYAGFSVDDVRRPVYRGNIRYKRHLLNYLLQADNGANESSSSFSSNLNRNLPSFSELPSNLTGQKREDVPRRNVSEVDAQDSLENETWALIPQSPSITENNHTKYLVHDFLKSTLKVLKSHNQEAQDLKLRSVETTPNPESLDKLIISHTGGQRPIQMYPEGSPPSWGPKPVDPNVILIEDVHPSKLPKPANWAGNRPVNKPDTWYKPEDNNHYEAVKPTYETDLWDKPIDSYHEIVRPIYKPDPWDKPTDSHHETVKPLYKPDPWDRPTDYNHQETLRPVYKPDQYNPGSIIISSHRPKPQYENNRPPVILVEDVSPSKLPLPDNQWSSQTKPHYELLTTTSKPGTSGKPVVVIHSKPTYQSPNYNPTYQPITLRPKPTRPSLIKPITENYSDLTPLIDKPVEIKPQVVHPKPITVKPVFLHPKPLKPVKRPNRPVSTSSADIIRPAVLHEVQITTQTGFTSSKPSPGSITFHKPGHSPVTVRPKPPVQYKPIYSSYPTSGTFGGARPDYRPVQLYPNTGPSPEPPPKPHVPIHPPLNESPRPPEAPYRDPPVKPNKPLGSAIIFSHSTLPPVTVTPSRPPPPSIVILEAEPEEPPIIEDCGTVHIINDVKAQKSCSDVMILLNSPLAVANSAAAGGAAGGAAAAAAAAGAGAAAAAGAGAAAAAGAGAAAAAGVGAAAAAAGAASSAASAGIGQAAGGGPSSTGGSAAVPANPILHPLQDETSSEEDYDYEEEVSSPPSTNRPPSTSMTLYDYITSFASALPYIGPIGVSLGILILGPLGFMILTALGVGILIFPWILPRIIFGRRRRRSLLYKPEISASASLFLRNLNSGYFNQYGN